MNKIINILNHYRKKKSIHEFIKGIILLILSSISIFSIFVFFEYLFYIETPLRSNIILFYLSIIAINSSYLIIKFIITYYSLLDYYNHDSIAKELGQKYNEIKDQLLNVIQINQQGLKQTNDLTQIATNAIYKKLKNIYDKNFTLILPKYLSKAFILCVLLLIIITITPNFQKASKRLINYNKDFSPPYPFILTSLSKNITALSGDTITINIAGIGNLSDSIDFYWVEKNKKNVQKISHDKEIYKMKLQNIDTNIIYWSEYKSTNFLSSWDIIKTDIDTLKVKDRPKIRYIEFNITPPPYTNLSSSIETLENINQVDIIKGSTIDIYGEIDKSLNSAWLLNKNNNERIDINISNNTFSKKILLDNNLIFSIYLLDEELIPNLNPKQYSFICKNDTPPIINIQSPSIEFNIDETMIIPIQANIIDDFGLEQILIEYEIISEFFNDLTQPISTYIINKNLNAKSYNLNFNWDINKVPISMGDELHFKIGAIDNNNIDGNQKVLSHTIIGKFPSLENLFLEIEEIEDNTSEILDEIDSSIEEIADLSQEIRRELLKSDDSTWEQENKLNNSFEEINSISSKIEEIQENINSILDKAENNQLFDNDLINKFEKFQDLMSNIMSEELQDSIEKLQEALKSLNLDDITKALENFEFNVNQFEQQLDRYIEMFEAAMTEQKLNELSEYMENMIDKQIDLMQDVSNNQDEYVLEKKSMKQENRFSNFKDLLNETSKQIKDSSNNTSQELSDLLNDTIIEETNNLLKEQTQNTKNQTNSQKIKDNLSDIKSIVNNAQEGFQSELNAKLTKEFIRIIDNLITISNQQEYLIIQSKELRSNSPHLQTINREQFNIDRQFNQITKQLIDLSNTTFFVNPKINRLIGKLKSTIAKIISNFEQKNISKGKNSQKESLKKINEITYLLLESMEEMQASNSASGFEKFMESLENMSNTQEGVNQGTMQLGQMGMMQQQAIMQQLMQQQAQLKQQLSELINDNPGEATGPLSKAEEQMEEVLSDFKKNNINKKTIERQQSILSKMLDSQKSLKQRDYSNKRDSKTANKTVEPNNIIIPEDYGEKDLFYISAMEKALKNNSDSKYDDMIRLYFLNLQKEMIENEN